MGNRRSTVQNVLGWNQEQSPQSTHHGPYPTGQHRLGLIYAFLLALHSRAPFHWLCVRERNARHSPGVSVDGLVISETLENLHILCLQLVGQAGKPTIGKVKNEFMPSVSRRDLKMGGLSSISWVGPKCCHTYPFKRGPEGDVTHT